MKKKPVTPGHKLVAWWKQQSTNRKTLYIVGIVLIIIVLGMSTSGDTQEAGPTKNKNTPVVISDFNLFEQANGDLEIQMSVKDAAGFPTSASGELAIDIRDENNMQVYANTQQVTYAHFTPCKYKLTGVGSGLCYISTIPKSTISKGYSDDGIAYVSLKAGNNVLTAQDDYVSLPHYSEKETTKLTETDYEKNSKYINTNFRCGPLVVYIYRLGWYDSVRYGETNRVFRIDFGARNTNNEVESLRTSSAVVLHANNQYERNTGSEFDGNNIHPRVTKDGYLLYDAPSNIRGDMKIYLGYVYDSGYKKKDCIYEYKYN